MDTITIQKQELKNIIKEAIHEELHKINHSFVSNKEQAELEAEFGKNPIFEDSDEVVKL